MYAEATSVQVGTYEDLWRRGRYRVELGAEVAGDSHDVDAALDRLGYEAVDADQWGRSYRCRYDPRRMAELDELEDPSGLVRLILRQGDLAESEIPSAEGQLDAEYARLCSYLAAAPSEAGWDECLYPWLEYV